MLSLKTKEKLTMFFKNIASLELSIEDSQRVSDHLGFKNKIEIEMTLAEIYNQEDKLSDLEKKEEKLIGFGR